MPAVSLHQFVNRVADRASAMFKQRGQILPMYHAIDGMGSDVIFPSPHENKDIAVSMVRALLKAMEATRVAYLDEAWMLDLQGQDFDNADMDKIHREGVSKDPRRVEVVLISAEDREEGLLMASREIIRHGNKAVLGKLKIMNRQGDGESESFEGRMVGLLPSPKARH